MKIFTKSRIAKAKRITLNIFRAIVFLEQIKPGLVEIGTEDIIAESEKMAKKFVKKEVELSGAVTLREDDIDERIKELEKLKKTVAAENKEINLQRERVLRVAKRYEELHS